MDRSDNRRLLLAGAAAYVVAAGAGLLVSAFPAFLLTRAVSGAGVVFVFVGSVNVLGRVLPEDRRALGISLFVTSPPVGLAIGQAATPLVAEPYGWRAAVLAYVLLSVVGAFVFAGALRRPIVPETRITASAFLATLRRPSVLLVSLAGLCTYAVWTFLNTWMPSYGTDVLGVELAAAGAATALVPIGGIVARPAGGWLSERIGGRSVPVIAASFLASIVLLSFLSLAPSPGAFAVLLALTGAAVNLSVGVYLVYVPTLADASTRGTSLSVLAAFSQVGNLAAPVAGGWLIAELSWTAGFGFAVGLAVVGLLAIALVRVDA